MLMIDGQALGVSHLPSELGDLTPQPISDFVVRALQAGMDAFSLHYPFLDEAVSLHGLRTAESWPLLAQMVMSAIERRISAQMSSTRVADGAERAATPVAQLVYRPE